METTTSSRKEAENTEDQRRQLQRVAEMVEDLNSDDESEASQRSKPKPGSITPMGVRVDKGQGLLSVSGASTTLAEMDAAISNIRGWQQRHEREMSDMMRRHEAALQAAMAPKAASDSEEGEAQGQGVDVDDDESASSTDEAAGDSQRQPQTSGSPSTSSTAATTLEPRRTERSKLRPASAHPASASHSPCPSSQPCSDQQQPSLSNLRHSLGPGQVELLKASMNLRFAQLPGDTPRPSTGSRLRPATAGPRLLPDPSPLPPRVMTASSGVNSPPRGGLLPPLPGGAAQQALHSLGTPGPTGARVKDSQPGDEVPWQRRSLSRASSSSSAGAVAARQPDVLTLPQRSSRGGSGSATPHPQTDTATTATHSLEPELSSRLNRPGSGASGGTAARPLPGSEAVPLGQRLMDELEEELRALDDDAVGNEVSGWYTDYESVLARMDRLQSGYQVQVEPEVGSQSKQTLSSRPNPPPKV